MGIKHTVETVTPKKAAEWLKRNINNRPLPESEIQFLAGAMLDGKWELNGDAIRFNTNGDLIDGQTRLSACVRSGVSFQTLVVRGLQHSTFNTFDGGRRRTAKDDLHVRGEKNCNMTSGACRAVIMLLKHDRYDDTIRLRRDQIAEFLENTPAIRESLAYANAYQTGIMGRAIVASLHYLFSIKDQRLANDFWDRVLKGEGLNCDMPEYRLREQLIRKRSAPGTRLRSPFVYGLTIKAWNARRDGGKCRCLKYDPSTEDFPKIK